MKAATFSHVYALPYLRQIILYAPLARFACLLPSDILDASVVCSEEALSVDTVETLQTMGVLPQLEGSYSVDLRHQSHHPCQATLLLTQACNLRCVYCYGSAGKDVRTMPWPVACAVIEQVITNTLAQERKTVHLGFHGGGEPYVAWSLLNECVAYARQRCREENLRLTTSVNTNGILTQEKITWTKNNIDYLTISCDGLPEVHNRQRPFQGGKGSFSSLQKTCQALSDSTLDIEVRLTVTSQMIQHLTTTLLGLVRLLNIKTFRLEPLFIGHRGRSDHELSAPDVLDFIKAFGQARREIRAQGGEVIYAPADLNRLSQIYCDAPSENMIVAPDGTITACYLAVGIQSDNLDRFCYGRIESGTDIFVFNQSTCRTLMARTTSRLPGCSHCAFQWHCGGDCPARHALTGQYDFPAGTHRCHINRTLLWEELLERLNLPIAPVPTLPQAA